MSVEALKRTIFSAGYPAQTQFHYLGLDDGAPIHTLPSKGFGLSDATMLSPTVLGGLVYGTNTSRYGPVSFDLETNQTVHFESAPSFSSGAGMDSFANSDGDTMVAAKSGGRFMAIWRYDPDTRGGSVVHSFGNCGSWGDVRYASLPSPSLLVTGNDNILRIYDPERGTETSTKPNCAAGVTTWYRTAYSQEYQSLFVSAANNTTSLRQVDLRTMTYPIDSKNLSTHGGSTLFSVGVMNEHYLMVGGAQGYVGMFDLRSMDQPVWFKAGAHPSCNVFARPAQIDADTFATSGYSSDRNVRTWKILDGAPGWTAQVSPNGAALCNVSQCSYRSLSPVADFFASDACVENKDFLLEQMEILHDARVKLVDVCGEELAVFETFRSLLKAGGRDREEEEEVDLLVVVEGQCQVLEIVVTMACGSVSLTSEQFNGILLGSLTIQNMINECSPKEIFDLCEVVSHLQMKKFLWWICEEFKRIFKEEDEMSVTVAFNLFKSAYERFEEEEDEGESDEDESLLEDEDREGAPGYSFASVVTTALFEAFKGKEQRGVRLGRKTRLWLGARDLYRPFKPQGLQTHPQLNLTNEEEDGSSALPPEELLADVFLSFDEEESSVTKPNVELISQMFSDSVPVFSHIEALVLSFDFFKMCLRFVGHEREVFQTSRKLEMEELTPKALETLVHFAYVRDMQSVPLLDLILTLRFAEKSHDESLMDACIESLESIDTNYPTFLEDLSGVGNALDDVQARVQILQAWAGQGAFSMKKLMKILTRSRERAETKQVAITSETEVMLRREITGLKTVIEGLRVELEDEREARERVEADVIVLKEQMENVLKRLN